LRQVGRSSFGNFHSFRVQVYLDEPDLDAVLVENAEPRERQPMTRGEALVESVNGFICTAQIPSNRPANVYAPRLVPTFLSVHVPLEAGRSSRSARNRDPRDISIRGLLPITMLAPQELRRPNGVVRLIRGSGGAWNARQARKISDAKSRSKPSPGDRPRASGYSAGTL